MGALLEAMRVVAIGAAGWLLALVVLAAVAGHVIVRTSERREAARRREQVHAVLARIEAEQRRAVHMAAADRLLREVGR